MLSITYKSGVRRFINVPFSFYLDFKTGDKISNTYLKDKVTDLISDFGPYKELYHATMDNGQETILEIGPNKLNEPIKPEEDWIVRDYSLPLRNLKRETKGYVYTQKILRNSDGVFVTAIHELA